MATQISETTETLVEINIYAHAFLLESCHFFCLLCPYLLVAVQILSVRS